MPRCLPPAGQGIGLSEILRSIFAPPKEDFLLRDLSLDSPCFFVSSGTAALCLGLKAINDDPSRKRVVLPAYTCPSLLSAVVKARLEPVLCDLKPNTFQLDPEQLSLNLGEKTLAIIAVHLFGLPENMTEIKRRTQNKQVIIIEDAAQGLGNRLVSPKTSREDDLWWDPPTGGLGSTGDMGVLSFGRGKPLSMLGGGAVLVNSPVFYERVKRKYEQIGGPESFVASMRHVAQLVAYSIFFHPSLYNVPARLPGLRLGETIFSLDFDVKKAVPHMFRIGNTIAARFAEIRQVRLRVADMYRKSLEQFREDFAFMPDQEGNDDSVALLRFPIIFNRKEKRDRILAKLKAEGLGATGMYPAPLNEIPGTSPYLASTESYPVAKSISERLLTLPLHEYVTMRDIEKITSAFQTP